MKNLNKTFIEKQIIVDAPPELITKGKGGTDRYDFGGAGYSYGCNKCSGRSGNATDPKPS